MRCCHSIFLFLPFGQCRLRIQYHTCLCCVNGLRNLAQRPKAITYKPIKSTASVVLADAALCFAFRQDCWYNKYIPSGRLCGQERSPLWKHLTRARPCFICPVCLNFMTCMRRFSRFYRAHREYFYDWCAIGSIYGAPSDCLWAGGRVEYSDRTPREVLALTREYGISARLTLSNSLLRPEHLTDPDCNALCRLFQEQNDPQKRRHRSC